MRGTSLRNQPGNGDSSKNSKTTLLVIGQHFVTTSKDAEEGNIWFIFWIQCIEQETFYYDLCSESFSNLCFSDVDLELDEEEAWLRRRRSGAATKGGFLVRPVNHRRTALAN